MSRISISLNTTACIRQRVYLSERATWFYSFMSFTHNGLLHIDNDVLGFIVIVPIFDTLVCYGCCKTELGIILKSFSVHACLHGHWSCNKNWKSNRTHIKFCPGGDGFGGLVVSMLASGSNPAEVVGFFRHLKNPPHAFLRRGSERICPMSQLCGI